MTEEFTALVTKTMLELVEKYEKEGKVFTRNITTKANESKRN
jgi:hypothetical protein